MRGEAEAVSAVMSAVRTWLDGGGAAAAAAAVSRRVARLANLRVERGGGLDRSDEGPRVGGVSADHQRRDMYSPLYGNERGHSLSESQWHVAEILCWVYKHGFRVGSAGARGVVGTNGTR